MEHRLEALRNKLKRIEAVLDRPAQLVSDSRRSAILLCCSSVASAERVTRLGYSVGAFSRLTQASSLNSVANP